MMIFTQSSWNGPVIAEAEEIELEALALDHAHIGDVVDVDGRIVGLCRDGAEAGELGADEFDEIVVVGVFVVERFQNFRRVFAWVLGFLVAQKGDALQLFVVAGHEVSLVF